MNVAAAALALAAAPVVAAPDGAPVAEDGAARRDPFAPFDAAERVAGGERCKESVAACASLDEVAIRGIVSGVASPRVMVEVRGGQNVVLRTGDLLALGRIVAIRRTGVVIERVSFSQLGGSKKSLVSLPFG